MPAIIKIYAEDNYVIVEEGSNVFEYAKGYTTYTLIGSTYTIKETVGGEYKFTQEQLTSGDIRKEDNSSYTEESFKTFLRQNTGFKTAAGGSAATPIGALLTKSGQTTSYRSGDDGDLESGRATSFTVLLANNPFGNTNRFTDTLGGQTYANNIVIDWSTYDGTNVLGLSRAVVTTGKTWNQSIDECLAFSVGTFTSGWRLPNIKEVFNFLNYANDQNNLLNYSPINLGSSGRVYWTSNTLLNATTQAYVLSNIGLITAVGKTTSVAFTYFPVRTFTVTGTKLS
jgi:hypothetical protein